jgi:Alr-MurF fusion protein
MNFSDYDKVPGESMVLNKPDQQSIHHLSFDTREIKFPKETLFFAIKGSIVDGHLFINKAYDLGVRNFVLSDDQYVEQLQDCNYCISQNSVATLQKMAEQHRSRFHHLKSIGITGSNGKTIVKEWLSNLLSNKYKVVKTPQSYNSQIGVALSVWQINDSDEIGIFEAGISSTDEMDQLKKMIQPSIGIFTNIGDAHQSGFGSIQEKINEKLKLFHDVDGIVYCGDHSLIKEAITLQLPHISNISWGYGQGNKYRISDYKQDSKRITFSISIEDTTHQFRFNFSHETYFENLVHCIVCSLHLGLTTSEIEESIASISSLDMRLQVIEGLNGLMLINDSYTNDIQALDLALGFMSKHGEDKKQVIILSDLDHGSEEDYKKVITKLNEKAFSKILLLGSSWKSWYKKVDNALYFENMETLMSTLDANEFVDHILLLKGARKYGFEKISMFLQKQSHSVYLDIDMKALSNNLSVFSSMLNSESTLMPIIKANAYGAGSIEVAKMLQYKGIKTIGVAFADEAVLLKQNGITIPIVVLNADTTSFHTILSYGLELEIYSLEHLRYFGQFQNGDMIKKNGIHLKFDTGMSRLGFQMDDLPELLTLLDELKPNVISVFSHLASSEDEEDDFFTRSQAELFLQAYDQVAKVLGTKPKRHLLNSSGIIRFPEYHFDWVRLGLGLYGIDGTGVAEDRLEKVHSLKARIIQIKSLNKGQFVGYNRRFKVERPTTIAIINIGYADGFIRLAGNSKYHVSVNNKLCPIIGNVCMDLIIVDITSVNAKIGDEVIMFDKNLPIEELARVCQTIPYEVLCRISSRIKRNYLY